MKLYVVRNFEGKFFRPVGMGGSGGTTWQTHLEKAKFYSKIGPARAVVSNWNSFDTAKKYAVCDILEFDLDATKAIVIKNDDYVKKARVKILKREIAAQLRQLESSYGHTMYANHHKECIRKAQKELDDLTRP